MKFLLFIGLCFGVIVNIHGQSDVKLVINSKLPVRYTKNVHNRIATAAAQSFPYAEIEIKDVTYRIAFDPKDRKIKYIETTDEDFISNARMRAGSEVTVKFDEILVYDYFQLRLKPDKNGWQIVLNGGFETDRSLIDRIRADGHFNTTVWAFVKGYNY